MKIAVASDHRGVGVKRRIINYLREREYETVDFGTDSEESVDYPDFAAQVARSIGNGARGRAGRYPDLWIPAWACAWRRTSLAASAPPRFMTM